MQVDISGQVIIFIYSILSGALLSFIYDLFRVKRKLAKTSSIPLFFEDLIFWIIVSIVMFAVVYRSNDGELRGYILIGTLIGVVLYMLLLSRTVIRVTIRIVEFIALVINWIWVAISIPIKFAAKTLKIPLRTIYKTQNKIYSGVKSAGKKKIQRLRFRKKSL